MKADVKLERYRGVGEKASQLLTYAIQVLNDSRSASDLNANIRRHAEAHADLRPRWLSVGIGVNDRYVNNVWYENKRLATNDLVKIEIGLDIDSCYLEVGSTFVYRGGDNELGEVARSALDRAIAQTRVGRSICNISQAIQTEIESNGFYVSLYGAGHAIGNGKQNRKYPWVPNVVNGVLSQNIEVSMEEVVSSLAVPIEPSMILALEPMVNESTGSAVQDEFRIRVPDTEMDLRLPFWRTADGGRTAKEIHTIYVTEDSNVVLTADSRDC